MNKQQFLDLGLTEELATKAEAESKKELEIYIPKSRFDEVNTAKKTAEEQIKTLTKDLEVAKENSGDNEALKKQLSDAIQKQKDDEKAFATQMKELKISNAIKLAIKGKVHDEDLVVGLIDKSKITFTDNGEPIGIDEQYKEIEKNKPFLIKQEQKQPQFSGINPVDGSKTPQGYNPWKKDSFNLTDQGKIFKENPEQAKQLMAQAGVNI